MRRSTAVWRPVRLTVNGTWPPQILINMKLEAKAFRFFPAHYTKSAIYIYCQVYKAISISNPLLSYSVTPSPPNPVSICKPFEDWQDWRGCSTSCGPGIPCRLRFQLL